MPIPNSKRHDLSGRRVGMLTVIGPTDNRKRGSVMWECLCDCGKTRLIARENLAGKHSSFKSCGCLKGRSRPRHGHTTNGDGSPTYNSWQSMRNRCENPKTPGFERYGGRGISVCKRWHTFENFLADMGERPAGTSLDRADNDGNYEPANCRWATTRQQNSNKVSTRFVTAFGETKSLVEWAEYDGIKSNMIRRRLLRGWSPESAVQTPSLRTA